MGSKENAAPVAVERQTAYPQVDPSKNYLENSALLNLPNLPPSSKKADTSAKLAEILELVEPPLCELIEVDTRCLNFGAFYPGKIFKCNLRLTNLSATKRTISLRFDQDSAEFSDQFLVSEFSEFIGPKTLAAILGESTEIPNTEATHKCWHFMLLPSKAFEKSLTISLNPGQRMEVGVVIKSPQIVLPKKFCSVLLVSLAGTDSLYSNVKDSIKVLSVAEVDTPKLECTRELLYSENGIHVVPLVVRFEDADIQRLKVPFRNNGSQDLDLMLSVVPYPGGGTQIGEISVNVLCAPNSCKIPAKGMGLINLNAILNDRESQTDLTGRQQRVLIAKVKNTQMLYYFVLDFTFILSYGN